MKKLELSIKLANIPKPARIAIAVVPTIIFAVLFFFLVISPKSKQVDFLKGEISKQETKIAKDKSKAARLEELRVENKRLKENLLLLQEQLPEEEEISSLLKQVSDLGVEAGLKILTWRPSARRKHKSGIVYEVPVDVTFSGSYHNLGRFFASLTTLDRIVNVNNIKLGGSAVKGEAVVLNISFSAITFTAVSQGGIAK
jgi:type IV pilus assembly protein PilO